MMRPALLPACRPTLALLALACAFLALPASAGAATLVRSPYLQQATPTSIVVRWRTDVPTASEVRYGTTPGVLDSSVTDTTPTTEHEVALGGLTAETAYYYSVGSPTEVLAGGDGLHVFRTPPLAGARRPLRFWVIGDSGECAVSAAGCTVAGLVRDGFLAFTGSRAADALLLLGDNAYNLGTDQQYTDGFFAVYPQVLRTTVVWPTPGNHEFGASDSPTQSGPYYDAFTMPTLGEAGGMPSGTEAYYSFDVGNVHVISLDSHDTDRSVGGAMYNWLEADLQATTADFVIAVWHHPPYTKGSHDSDNPIEDGGRMFHMRERFVPLLEAYGVDLQLTGHSHSYERSMLIDGHYGPSSTFDPALHLIDGGNGDPDGDGAYAKPTLGPAPHEGAVYSVVGSSSKVTGVLTQHPVMTVWLRIAGSLVIDVTGRTLDAWFLDGAGNVADHFRIDKGPPLPACSNGLDDDGDGAFDFPDDIGCRDGTWTTESPACDDGLDNDGDGTIDWDGAGLGPADPTCKGLAYARRERPRACGLGFELAPLAYLWAALRRRRRPRRRSAP